MFSIFNLYAESEFSPGWITTFRGMSDIFNIFENIFSSLWRDFSSCFQVTGGFCLYLITGKRYENKISENTLFFYFQHQVHRVLAGRQFRTGRRGRSCCFDCSGWSPWNVNIRLHSPDGSTENPIIYYKGSQVSLSMSELQVSLSLSNCLSLPHKTLHLTPGERETWPWRSWLVVYRKYSEADHSPSHSSLPPTSPLQDIIKGPRRSFYLRLREKPGGKTEKVQYEHMNVVGHLKTVEGQDVFVGLMRPVKDRPITELSLMEAIQDQYLTRHLPDGRIIYSDHRISTIAGKSWVLLQRWLSCIGPKIFTPFFLKKTPKNLSFKTQITPIFLLKPNFCLPLGRK